MICITSYRKDLEISSSKIFEFNGKQLYAVIFNKLIKGDLLNEKI